MPQGGTRTRIPDADADQTQTRRRPVRRLRTAVLAVLTLPVSMLAASAITAHAAAVRCSVDYRRTPRPPNHGGTLPDGAHPNQGAVRLSVLLLRAGAP